MRLVIGRQLLRQRSAPVCHLVPVLLHPIRCHLSGQEPGGGNRARRGRLFCEGRPVPAEQDGVFSIAAEQEKSPIAAAVDALHPALQPGHGYGRRQRAQQDSPAYRACRAVFNRRVVVQNAGNHSRLIHPDPRPAAVRVDRADIAAAFRLPDRRRQGNTSPHRLVAVEPYPIAVVLPPPGQRTHQATGYSRAAAAVPLIIAAAGVRGLFSAGTRQPGYSRRARGRRSWEKPAPNSLSRRAGTPPAPESCRGETP